MFGNIDFRFFESFEFWKIMFLVSFGICNDDLNVSMRFSVVFCKYEHIKKYFLGFVEISEMFDFYIFFVLKWSPHPHPHPRRQKKSCEGANKLEKTHV